MTPKEQDQFAALCRRILAVRDNDTEFKECAQELMASIDSVLAAEERGSEISNHKIIAMRASKVGKRRDRRQAKKP